MTRPTFEERLADPAGHFPYKHEEALRGVARAVDREVSDLDLPADALAALRAALLEDAEAEVDATADYVAAQEAWFREQTPEAREAERVAARALAEARLNRRLNRPRLLAEAVGGTTDDTQEG